jgi:aromatic-L-amino-acid decarboxylase
MSINSKNTNIDMPISEFRKVGHELIDWVADYLNNIEQHPVLSKVKPNSIIEKLPTEAPQNSEQMSEVINDLNRIIMPGITHWNHPGFMAYFNSTSSGPGILGELLSGAFNINGMIWKTSPASTELETVVLSWLRKMLNLPENFWGIIYDLASISSLHAIAAAREQAKEMYADYDITKLKIYISEHAHSSIEKAVKTLGLSKSAIVKVKVNDNFSMIPSLLEEAILKDIQRGFQPFCVVATFGTTSTTSIDPILEISKISKNNNLWLHIDAAYAGSAAILPEIRSFLDGVENADSLVLNPHKWMFVPIDLSVLYTTKPKLLKKAFSVVPEYLKTNEDENVTNYMDYGIQLGRRFRSLKLWFVIRYFGVKGLQNIIREHIRIAKKFANYIDLDDSFIRMAPTPFSTVCFRAVPNTELNINELNHFNKTLMEEVNNSGLFYLSHTKLDGKFTIRLVISGIRTTEQHMEDVWSLIKEKTKLLNNKT